MRNLFWYAIVSIFCMGVALAEEPVKVPVDPDGVQRIEVVGGSYFYKPSQIIVKVNVPVELTVKKESGITPHDIVMKEPEAGIDFKESLGTEPKVIKFTPTKTGIFSFFCSKKPPLLESHRKKGMEGKLEVVE